MVATTMRATATEDHRGRPSATVTTVLVPDTPWEGEGPRPLLSYQTAEDAWPASARRRTPSARA